MGSIPQQSQNTNDELFPRWFQHQHGSRVQNDEQVLTFRVDVSSRRSTTAAVGHCISTPAQFQRVHMLLFSKPTKMSKPLGSHRLGLDHSCVKFLSIDKPRIGVYSKSTRTLEYESVLMRPSLDQDEAFIKQVGCNLRSFWFLLMHWLRHRPISRYYFLVSCSTTREST